jgi:hypothetical protein
MLEFMSTAVGHLTNLVLVLSVLNACAHLREICDTVQELMCISYHVSEIRRRLTAIEKRLPPVKETKAD